MSRPDAVAVLCEMEWGAHSNAQPRYCVWCNRNKDDGHASGCRLAAVIAPDPLDASPDLRRETVTEEMVRTAALAFARDNDEGAETAMRAFEPEIARLLERKWAAPRASPAAPEQRRVEELEARIKRIEDALNAVASLHGFHSPSGVFLDANDVKNTIKDAFAPRPADAADDRDGGVDGL